MVAQPLFRSAFMVEEQKNGFYTVRVDEWWTRRDINGGVYYPNLTWDEVATLAQAKLDEWAGTRATVHQMILAAQEQQMTIFDTDLGQV